MNQLQIEILKYIRVILSHSEDATIQRNEVAIELANTLFYASTGFPSLILDTISHSNYERAISAIDDALRPYL